MAYSQYKNLELPAGSERYSIDTFNNNNRIIDSELHKLELENQRQDELLATKEMLNSETARATTKENQLSVELNGEIDRARASENMLSGDITDEANRALAAEKRVHDALSSHILNQENIHKVTKSQVGLGNVDNTADLDKPVSKAVQETLDALYRQLTGYTDQEIADLIDGAPSTLDTLGELAQAMRDNESIVDALDEAVGKKANASELDSHIKDRANPHLVTKEQVGLGNVGNYKAVSTSASQGLTDAEKANARSNIGAGTSSFSGNYNDLANKPAIPSIPGSLPANGGHASTADAATKATQDGDGRIIADTYYHIHGNYGFNNATDHTKYVHLFTIDPFTAYVTDQYVFCVASRTDGVSTICVSVSSGADGYVNCNITYYGNELGNKIRGYEYKKTNEGKTTVEIYFIMTGWDDARFYPLLYHSRTTSAKWDVREFGALPTNATREVVPRYLEWGGNAVTANSASQAGNADTIDGFHASKDWRSVHTCVVRNGTYVDLDYVNYNTVNNEQSSISQVLTTNGSDNYLRKVSVARMKDAIGLGNVNNTADANKSVNYANNAGYANSAGSVAYGNVSGRPTFSLSGSTLYINF